MRDTAYYEVVSQGERLRKLFEALSLLKKPSAVGDYVWWEDGKGYEFADFEPEPVLELHLRAEAGRVYGFRHACYAGVADLFVSNDGRMREILTTMVVDRRAEVLSPDEFLRA